jgi:hypothetical protein
MPAYSGLLFYTLLYDSTATIYNFGTIVLTIFSPYIHRKLSL